MGRRRYISTDASKDKAIARLSRDAGFLAPLLFFMAIPHGDEAGYLPGDAAEFRLLICPGLPVSDEQVEEALTQIVNHRLWSRNGAGIRYKPESWRRIQSYITDSRFESAQNAALQRTSAQNSASSKVGWGVELELKSKAAAPLSPPAPQAAAAAASDSLNQFSPLAQKTIALYENTIGPITGMVANLISDFMDSYKGKPEWVDLAFKEAAKNQARTWAYVEAILQSWAAHGGLPRDKHNRLIGLENPFKDKTDAQVNWENDVTLLAKKIAQEHGGRWSGQECADAAREQLKESRSPWAGEKTMKGG